MRKGTKERQAREANQQTDGNGNPERRRARPENFSHAIHSMRIRQALPGIRRNRKDGAARSRIYLLWIGKLKIGSKNNTSAAATMTEEGKGLKKKRSAAEKGERRRGGEKGS